jgi:membrane protein DedA with SNARE-associated domain
MDFVTQFINFILGLISTSGYLGVFLLMVLESAVMPIPSEVVMPFAGYLASTGTFDLTLIVLVGTLGNLVGSLIAYYVGLRVGRAAILKYGKYVLLRESHLVIAENWFKKYGSNVIFFSRMTPIVRTVISLPAGISKMNLKKFSILTFLGSLPWTFALAFLGFFLGNNWGQVEGLGNVFNVLVIVGVFAAIAFYAVRRYRKGQPDRKIQPI